VVTRWGVGGELAVKFRNHLRIFKKYQLKGGTISETIIYYQIFLADSNLLYLSIDKITVLLDKTIFAFLISCSADTRGKVKHCPNNLLYANAVFC